MSLKSLIKKRDALLLENAKLKTELKNKEYNSKVNDIIKSINNYSGQRGGKYKDLIFHPDYETKWKGTFFDVQRPLIEKLNAYPINRLELYKQGSSNNPFAKSPYEERPGSLIGYCDMVVPTKAGPVIRITDPYGSVTFPPLKFTSYESAVNWLGHIIIVHALYKFESKNPEVKEVQALSFTLREDIRSTS